MLVTLRRVLYTLILAFLVVSVVWTLAYGFLRVPITPLMISQRATSGITYQWVPIDAMGCHPPLAVISAEDQQFFEHHGFDLAAIREAMTERRERMRGASTISQQTAKNAFLLPHRSWVRKGLEAYFTVLIELFWTKKRILEVYLNIIEFAPGVYGIEAAAQHYFQKSASRLTRDQAARLAALLPSPRRYHPTTSAYVARQAGWIEGQMIHWGGCLDFAVPKTPGKN